MPFHKPPPYSSSATCRSRTKGAKGRPRLSTYTWRKTMVGRRVRCPTVSYAPTRRYVLDIHIAVTPTNAQPSFSIAPLTFGPQQRHKYTEVEKRLEQKRSLVRARLQKTSSGNWPIRRPFHKNYSYRQKLRTPSSLSSWKRSNRRQG